MPAWWRNASAWSRVDEEQVVAAVGGIAVGLGVVGVGEICPDDDPVEKHTGLTLSGWP